LQVSGAISREGCSGGEVFVGRFVVDVKLGRRKPVRTELNPMMGGKPLRFPVDGWHDSWTLAFEDYNNDGRPDFTLAELSCGNNAGYYLFTVSDTGRVKPLPLSTGGPVGAQGEAVSTTFRVTSDGFTAAAYDNSLGDYQVSIYRWNGRLSIFERAGRAVGGKLARTPAP
jgi:hypothetical protein